MALAVSLDAYLEYVLGKCGIRKGCLDMSLMATIFFLILVNFFVTVARQQKSNVWRVIWFIASILMLLLAILFGIRTLGGGA
jgi:cytochrome c oxidase assembly factor CtaG